MDEKLIARFWSLVDKNGPTVKPEIGACWVWTGANEKTTHEGYGVFTSPGTRNRPATHVSLEIDNRPVQPGLYACHVCDHPPCVRASHLFVGTPAENYMDCLKKGRRCKLNEQSVADIRNRLVQGVSATALAQEFSVSVGAIQHVGSGFTWAHVPMPEGYLEQRNIVIRQRLITKPKGEASARSILTDAKVRLIRSMKESGASRADIAEAVGVSTGTVADVTKGRTWRHVT